MARLFNTHWDVRELIRQKPSVGLGFRHGEFHAFAGDDFVGGVGELEEHLMRVFLLIEGNNTGWEDSSMVSEQMVQGIDHRTGLEQA
jgi:hypothetical protein